MPRIERILILGPKSAPQYLTANTIHPQDVQLLKDHPGVALTRHEQPPEFLSRIDTLNLSDSITLDPTQLSSSLEILQHIHLNDNPPPFTVSLHDLSDFELTAGAGLLRHLPCIIIPHDPAMAAMILDRYQKETIITGPDPVPQIITLALLCLLQQTSDSNSTK